ncbi:D-2-hydroxyacid dehydrogenase [Sediminispirochaeta smaragdinae]|uniref:D-isomer specific 2-hydroxyacid dehydrogenase NAD-binding protein n=1 Tax=Sediminispirochaeta smaragdinae (strain DSM 11293 / JCM 15392 / SEBR 4228) TaxID=573413 RepID=E1R4E3_SEDSS|nr:D-2-hydroxyacid dehydrogenase [Sediminispirochaeta smaragdinae]ADK81684.1 D-isomer specific 2-hydroxyacid dehydrogenase NAD-binding protein [Sediminispirochaeta smaragdinae DSM 11293]
MKIVVLDGYTENPGDLSWDALETLGDLTVYDRTPVDNEAEIQRRIANCEAVYTNKTPISAETIATCPSIKFIGVLATGYNVVDVKAASKGGILVSNIPAYGTSAVAQFAIAMLLELCHHVGHHDKAVHAGRWTQNADWCFWDYPLIELAGKTMGIIGLGRIGQATAKIAGALGMKVIAYDSFPNASGEQVVSYVDLDTLLAQSDVVVLHCPLFAETEGIINKVNIAKMKDGVIILNNSRGPLIVEQDLADALNSGKVYGAGLDVVSTEPIKEDNPLLRAKNCIITPHISWASKESRQRLMDVAVRNLAQYQLGQPTNIVNPE